MSESLSQKPILERKSPKIYEPWNEHEYTFIILHGRGDTPSNFSPLFLLSPATGKGQFRHLLHNVRMIFLAANLPGAPNPFFSNQWFNISSLKQPNLNQDNQIAGLKEHSLYIQDLITAEIKAGIPPEKIVLVGLSQGCAQILISLLTLTLTLDDTGDATSKNNAPLTVSSAHDDSSKQVTSTSHSRPRGQGREGGRRSPRLGAVIGMSGWLPFSDKLESSLDEHASGSESGEPAHLEQAEQVLRSLCERLELTPVAGASKILETPVFLGHGTADAKVNVALGETARDVLRRIGFQVEWFPYQDFGHWWKAPDEIDDILAFLNRQLGLVFIPEKQQGK